jgi:hypothetical protein
MGGDTQLGKANQTNSNPTSLGGLKGWRGSRLVGGPRRLVLPEVG